MASISFCRDHDMELTCYACFMQILELKIMIYSYNGVIYWVYSVFLFSDFGFSFWCGDNVWNNITNKLVSINDEYSFMKSGTHPLNLWWCLRNCCWTPVEGVYCVTSWIWFTGLLFSVRISFICHKQKSKENPILVVHRIIAALSVCTLWYYFLNLGEVVYLGTCI